MAVNKKSNRSEDSSLQMNRAYTEFVCAINGEDVRYTPEFDGFHIMSRPQNMLSRRYRPSSEIERAIVFMGLGHNDSDDVFTVQKDGYQGLVFEHAGQYFLSDWFYDLRSEKLEFMKDPFLKSESMEGLLSLANWAGSKDGGFSDDDRATAQDLVNNVVSLPREVPEVEEQNIRGSIREMLLDGFLGNMSEKGLQRLENRCMEQRSIAYQHALDVREQVSQLFCYAKPLNDVVSSDYIYDVKAKELPGLIGVRFDGCRRKNSDLLLFDGSAKKLPPGVKPSGDYYIKNLLFCSTEELESVLEAARKRIVRANEKPIFDLKDSDIKSWFVDLSLNAKKAVFSSYTEDEYGRYSPVHTNVTEENYGRISRKSNSEDELKKGLDEAFCSLNSRCLFDIYYHQAICEKHISPVRPSVEDLQRYSKAPKTKDYSPHR